MQVCRRASPRSEAPVALTIGNFDGVHLGHQAMLVRLKQVANQLNTVACVMTLINGKDVVAIASNEQDCLI